MAIQTVNIGTSPNDGTGDSLRSGGDKINDNFTDATNAASKLVQTSSIDGTTGRALEVGAFGLGAMLSIDWVTTIDDHTIPSGSYRAISANGGTFPSGITGGTMTVHRYNADATMQTFRPADATRRVYERTVNNGSSTAWAEVWTEGNYQPSIASGIGVVLLLRNETGGIFTPGSTTSGVNLKPVFWDASNAFTVGSSTFPGTWKEIGNIGSLPNLTTSYFVRIA